MNAKKKSNCFNSLFKKNEEKMLRELNSKESYQLYQQNSVLKKITLLNKHDPRYKHKFSPFKTLKPLQQH